MKKRVRFKYWLIEHGPEWLLFLAIGALLGYILLDELKVF